ncbi:ABC transporter permease [Bacteroides sp. ET489]|uniref:ABC transporter permease n=1 Tax=Bacteroides sp. ET489 TaxID=3057126 RepID=UPI0026741658|nr:ABC transporter permease [Bacteroides sp. ET489]MDO3389978.1 ABC transporter permease [Bacteroides sp. ET489]
MNGNYNRKNVMILNVTLKMILRSWWRNKVFFLVSVASLALGLACTNLLMTYFVHEHGLEGSNPDRDRIVFLRQDDPMNEGKRVAYAAADIPQRLKDSYAEVEDYLRLGKLDMLSCKVDGQKVDGSLILLSADTTLTRFFDYRTAQGSLEQVLHRPDQVALSAACARRLFGGGEAFGRHIEVQSESRGRQTYQVAAVLEERGQSLLQFDMLTAQTSDYWGGPTLLKLSPGADAVRLTDKINADQVPTLMPGQTKYHLDPLEAVCFTTPDDASQQTLDYISQTPVQTLYISLLAAVLILVIACCNYTNMSLSRLLQQLRMIHVEKLMGGTLRSIRLQLFGDAFLTVVLAFILSMLLVNDCLAVFNGLLGSRLTMGFFFSSRMLPWLLLFVLVMSVVPAWYISRRLSRLSFSQYRTLYGGRRKQRFVAVLVTVQFAISIGLLLATLTARRQMRLTERQADRYADCIEIGDGFGAPLAPLKAELEKRVQGIESVTLSNGPVLNAWIRQLTVKRPDGSEVHTNLLALEGDTSLQHTLHMEQLNGERPARLLEQMARPVLVNESFVRQLVPVGTDPVGRSLREFDAEADDSLAVVAGVVRDFSVNSLEEAVTPLVVSLLSESGLQKAACLQIRLRPESRTEALQQIESVWDEMNPGQPFRYTDMHREFMERNEKVLSLSHLLTFYALIGLLLTDFGLFGIAWYATRQRIREISIRKVHGATRGQIIWLLNKPFCLYAAVAYVLAMPVAWWLMQRWLEQFAYRAPLSVGIFVWPLVVVWGVSALIVCLQGWMLNRVKPVEAMKNE